MSVNCRKHPEHELCAHEIPAVFTGPLRSQKQIHDHTNPRPAVTLVLQPRRGASRLAEILLRKAQIPSFVCSDPSVKAFNNERLVFTETFDPTVGHFQAVGT